MSVEQAAASGDRLQTLIELRSVLAQAIDKTRSARDLPLLARRLMEVMSEVEALVVVACDEITAAASTPDAPWDPTLI